MLLLVNRFEKFPNCPDKFKIVNGRFYTTDELSSRRIMRRTFHATSIKTGRITGRTRRQRKVHESVMGRNLIVREWAEV